MGEMSASESLSRGILRESCAKSGNYRGNLDKAEGKMLLFSERN
jgi:hypothetical protein